MWNATGWNIFVTLYCLDWPSFKIYMSPSSNSMSNVLSTFVFPICAIDIRCDTLVDANGNLVILNQY